MLQMPSQAAGSVAAELERDPRDNVSGALSGHLPKSPQQL